MSVLCCEPTVRVEPIWKIKTASGSPPAFRVTAVPGDRPRSPPLITLLPVLVTVVAASTAWLAAVPRFTVTGAARPDWGMNMVMAVATTGTAVRRK